MNSPSPFEPAPPPTSWSIVDEMPADTTPVSASAYRPVPAYVPIIRTLRLYAGWLLAWYILILALGSYQHLRELPFTIPFVESLFLSPLIHILTAASFLFLFCTDLFRRVGGGFLKGIIILALGGFALYFFSVNI